jgi:hypothetical protein
VYFMMNLLIHICGVEGTYKPVYCLCW